MCVAPALIHHEFRFMACNACAPPCKRLKPCCIYVLFFPLPYHLVHVSLYLGTFSRVPRDLITGAQVGVLHHTHPSPTGNEEEESPELISALPFHFFNFFGKHVFISKILNVSKSGRLELHSDNFELELYLRIIC